MTLKLKVRGVIDSHIFSLTHKRKGPRVSNFLKKIPESGDAAHISIHTCTHFVSKSQTDSGNFGNFIYLSAKLQLSVGMSKLSQLMTYKFTYCNNRTHTKVRYFSTMF